MGLAGGCLLILKFIFSKAASFYVLKFKFAKKNAAQRKGDSGLPEMNIELIESVTYMFLFGIAVWLIRVFG